MNIGHHQLGNEFHRVFTLWSTEECNVANVTTRTRRWPVPKTMCHYVAFAIQNLFLPITWPAWRQPRRPNKILTLIGRSAAPVCIRAEACIIISEGHTHSGATRLGAPGSSTWLVLKLKIDCCEPINEPARKATYKCVHWMMKWENNHGMGKWCKNKCAQWISIMNQWVVLWRPTLIMEMKTGRAFF